MSPYLQVPLLFAVAILQATVIPHLAIWEVFADLPLLVVISWSLIRGRREGIVWGFVAGLAVDLFSGAPFGAATLSLMVAGFLAGAGAATVFRTHILLPLVTTFAVTIVYDLLFLLVVQIFGGTVEWFDSLWRIILPSAVLNTCLTPVVYGLARLLYGRFSQAEMEL